MCIQPHTTAIREYLGLLSCIYFHAVLVLIPPIHTHQKGSLARKLTLRLQNFQCLRTLSSGNDQLWKPLDKVHCSGHDCLVFSYRSLTYFCIFGQFAPRHIGPREEDSQYMLEKVRVKLHVLLRWMRRRKLY